MKSPAFNIRAWIVFLTLASSVTPFVPVVWAVQGGQDIETKGLSEIEYGELFVAQEKPENDHPWNFGAAYSYGFTNPYLAVHGAHLSAGYRFGRYFQAGLTANLFLNQSTGLAARMESELAIRSVEMQVVPPQYSAHVSFSIIPLSGVMNVFSVKTIGLEFPILLGLGVSQYEGQRRTYPSFKLGITPQAFFSEHFGVQLGVLTQIEHFGGGDWFNRWDVQIGLVGRI